MQKQLYEVKMFPNFNYLTPEFANKKKKFLVAKPSNNMFEHQKFELTGKKSRKLSAQKANCWEERRKRLAVKNISQQLNKQTINLAADETNKKHAKFLFVGRAGPNEC
jgi:hypothetical protein